MAHTAFTSNLHHAHLLDHADGASAVAIMEALVFVANLLYVSSYFVQDVLRLRTFTAIAATILAVYFGSLPEPLTTVVAWNLFFVALNVFQIVRITVQRARNDGRAGTRTTPSIG